MSFKELDLTRAFYDTKSLDYASATQRTNLLDVWRVLEEKLEPSSYILDLGCGAGRDLKHFGGLGHRCLGVDYSPNILRIAREYSGQEIAQLDFRTDSLGDNRFDAVWAVSSLIHVLRREVSAVLLNVHQSLKPAGFFLTSMQAGVGHEIADDGRYFELYDPSEWEDLLKHSGFTPELITTGSSRRTTGSGTNREVNWFVTLSRRA